LKNVLPWFRQTAPSADRLFLANPSAWPVTNQSRAVPREEKRRGILFKDLGHLWLKPVGLQTAFGVNGSETSLE
jgi:hypothetical protein